MAGDIQALIIGCGNIGGLYDLYEADLVWTHAKAFSLNGRINFSVYDNDRKKAMQVAEHYGVSVIEELTPEKIGKYQLVSITSPTLTHYGILVNLIHAGTPVIICEKPVSANIHELESLKDLYNQGQSKILVNYIRRFQPAFSALKKIIQHEAIGCKSIIIKYQRGFLNNASHAIDLLEYLFDSPMILNDFIVNTASFDAFEYDATLTGGCTFLDIPVLFAGVTNADYAIFELELFFMESKIVICHSGNDIRFYNKEENRQLLENIPMRKEGILKQYMLPVVKKAVDLLDDKGDDNFLRSVDMNLRLLKATEKIKN